MLIYLDNCCLNRPFDDQRQKRIGRETKAILTIRDYIRSGDLQLCWSYIIDYENGVNPFLYRKRAIWKWKELASVQIEENVQILTLARSMTKLGIKTKDSLHLSCAISQNCQYFITTDDFLIKILSKFDKIVVLNPVQFILVI